MNALLASALNFCASCLSCSVTSLWSTKLRFAIAGEGTEEGGVDEGPGEEGVELEGELLMLLVIPGQVVDQACLYDRKCRGEDIDEGEIFEDLHRWSCA